MRCRRAYNWPINLTTKASYGKPIAEIYRVTVERSTKRVLTEGCPIIPVIKCKVNQQDENSEPFGCLHRYKHLPTYQHVKPIDRSERKAGFAGPRIQAFSCTHHNVKPFGITRKTEKRQKKQRQKRHLHLLLLQLTALQMFLLFAMPSQASQHNRTKQ
jgi:hypothetical protein